MLSMEAGGIVHGLLEPPTPHLRARRRIASPAASPFAVLFADEAAVGMIRVMAADAGAAEAPLHVQHPGAKVHVVGPGLVSGVIRVSLLAARMPLQFSLAHKSRRCQLAPRFLPLASLIRTPWPLPLGAGDWLRGSVDPMCAYPPGPRLSTLVTAMLKTSLTRSPRDGALARVRTGVQQMPVRSPGIRLLGAALGWPSGRSASVSRCASSWRGGRTRASTGLRCGR